MIGIAIEARSLAFDPRVLRAFSMKVEVAGLAKVSLDREFKGRGAVSARRGVRSRIVIPLCKVSTKELHCSFEEWSELNIDL